MFHRNPKPTLQPTSRPQPIDRAKPREGNASTALATAPLEASSASFREEGTIIIGKGARVIGQISDCALLDVYGVLEADVIADKLIVREGGGVRGSIQTDSAEIHGFVEGDLAVHGHMDIRATGVISGNVSYDSMAIAMGGKIGGNLQLHQEVLDPEVDRNGTAYSANRRDEPVNGEMVDMPGDGLKRAKEIH